MVYTTRRDRGVHMLLCEKGTNMRRLLSAAVLVSFATVSATAADYKLEFASGEGKVLKGRGGLQVFDVTTDNTRMRIVAPGNRITDRGTVRVLVMNLGQGAYEFGPDQVSVELPNGQPLEELPVAVFDKGEKFVEREVGIGRSVDRAVKANLSSYAQTQSGDPTATSTARGSAAEGSANMLKNDSLEDQIFGGKLLEGLNGVLRPLAIGPQEAWGGYLVFNMPKALQRAKVDQPVVIVVRTGQEVHRIKAVLNRV